MQASEKQFRTVSKLTYQWINPGYQCVRLRSSKISIFMLVWKLQTFVYVAVTKEFTMIFFLR